MSDQWGPGAEDNEPLTPSPPPPPPPIESILTLDDETEITRVSRGVGGRAIAAIVGVVLLVGGTMFAVTQAGGSGPGSAEAAVAELLEAASDEDVLGLLAAIDPGERDAMRGPVEDLFAELERLEVLDESFELTGIAGVDLEFNDVTFRTEAIRDGLARVYLTGGTVTGSFNSDELPIGSFVEDTLDRFGGDISGISETETSDIVEGEEMFLVAHEGADGWRVSIGYSIAEAARLDADLPFPAGEGVEPIGADSPEAAVEGMVTALTDLDLRGMIARMSPGEFGALHEYAGLFLDDAEAALASVEGDVDLTVDDLDLRSETSGGRASVYVDGFSVTITIDEGTITVGYADQCVTIDGDLPELDDLPFDGPLCQDDAGRMYEDAMEELQGTTGLDLDLPELPTFDAVDIGITATQHDGEWYVAPIATGLDGTVDMIGALERRDLDAIVDFVEAAISSFTEAFTPPFEDLDRGFDSSGDSFDFGEDDFAPPVEDLDGVDGVVDYAGLGQMLAGVFPEDAATRDCMYFELIYGEPALVNELITAYQADTEPSTEAQQLLLDARSNCEAG